MMISDRSAFQLLHVFPLDLAASVDKVDWGFSKPYLSNWAVFEPRIIPLVNLKDYLSARTQEIQNRSSPTSQKD